MNELDILNHYQLAFVANAAYMLTFTGLIFITFRSSATKENKTQIY